MNSELYKELVQHYFELQLKRKTYLEHINVLETKYKVIDEQMARVNDILCKYGNHFYEYFEEKQTTSRSEETESELINCESTKCDNCVNHNECEYEPYPAERED
jgi:intein-encoded DNA endonuclease-like protein